MSSFADDPTILDPDPLWRRVRPEQIVRDGDGTRRPSSAVFQNSSDGSGMSVSLGREAQEAGISPARALADYPGFGLAQLTAGECRAHHQTMQRDPTDADPHHALVSGDKKRATSRALGRLAVWVVLPDS